MSEPRPEIDPDAPDDLEAELEEMARLEEEARENRPSLARLVDAGNVDGILALAKVYRAGDETMPRDLVKCVEAYEAAAGLGSSMASHAVGVFHMTGGPVSRDEAKAASLFRKAADAGYIPSKVYLANLYELGIHYATDAKKAGVWYRSVARSADIEHPDDSEQYATAMAELGCVRYCLQLADNEATSDDDRALYVRKARAHGYRPNRTPAPAPAQKLRIDAGARASASPERAAVPVTSTSSEDDDDDLSFDPDDLAFLEAAVAAEKAGDGLVSATPQSEPTGAPSAAADEPKATADELDEKPATGKATKNAKNETKAKAKTPLTWRTGFAAFVYAAVFMAIAVGAGFGLTAWAETLVASGEAAPIVGQQPALFLPLAVATIGLIPNLLVYRVRAVGKAIVAGGLFAIVGEALWGLGQTLLSHVTQVTVFAAAGLLLGLLVLGIAGEARNKSPKKAPTKAP